MSKNFQLKAKLQDQGKRLDKFLAEKMPEYSRAAIQKTIKEKNILLNLSSPTGESGQAPVKSSYKLKAGDIIEIKPPADKIDLSPDPSIKIKIIHEEKDFAVIDKPAGLVVYPGTKHEGKTLINGLLAVWPEIKSVGDPPVGGLRLRPGIVHRLDKDTSGIMIIAKNNKALQYFKNSFKDKKIEKTYTALVFGHLSDTDGLTALVRPGSPQVTTSGKIDFPIRRSKTNPVKQVAVVGDRDKTTAREAITFFKVLKYFFDKNKNQYTLVEAKPKTGRMHQIRVHLATLGYPVVGDKIYQKKGTPQLSEISRQLLHASAIKFTSLSGKEMNFDSPLPDDFSEFLKILKENRHKKGK